MKLEVLKNPNPILRKETEEVANFDMELQNFIDSMVETMRDHNGIGLAAPQVGSCQKIVVIEFQPSKDDPEQEIPLTVICNPVISDSSKEDCKMVEGCLSFPGMELIVERPKAVTVKGKDRYGNDIEIKADNLFARVLQHEIDHLNATLMIDHLKELNIVFFATGEFGTHALKSLINDPQYNVKAVVTGEKLIEKRGKKSDANAIKKIAKDAGLKVIVSKKLRNEADIIEQIKKIHPDVAVVVDFGQIIPREVFEIPIHGTVNIHPSLLPLLRGPSPIQSFLLSGERTTGVSLIKINEGVDSGPIISQVEVKTTGSENFQILFDYLSELGANLLLDSLPYYVVDHLKAKEQDESAATYTKVFKKEDGKVTLSDSGRDVMNKIRAFYPWPGVYIEKNGLKIQVTAGHLDREGMFVVDRVKPAGKNEMNYSDFVNGYKIELTFKP